MDIIISNLNPARVFRVHFLTVLMIMAQKISKMDVICFKVRMPHEEKKKKNVLDKCAGIYLMICTKEKVVLR